MGVSAVEVTTDFLEIERRHTDSVCPVECDQGIVLVCKVGERLDRGNQSRASRDVVAKEESCAGGDPGFESVYDLIRRVRRNRKLRLTNRHAPSLSRVVQAVVDGAVFLVGCEDLVAGIPVEAIDDGIDGQRHVRNEGQVVRARTGKGPETFASAFQAPGESAAIPLGVPFQLAKLANQVFVDDPGKNAPRSCVQIDVVLIIEKATTNVLPVRFV
tara:strand:- start:1483 stop:2127 length:645 start_codon:yes stop_codon:yes gene_type:complete